MTAPDRLSFSQLSTYEDCGEKYRLKYIEKHRDDIPAWWSASGSAIHLATEELDRGHRTDDIPGLWEWAFQTSIKEQKTRHPKVPMSKWRVNSKKQGEDYWQAEGLNHVLRYWEWRESTQWPLLEMSDGSLAIELRVFGTVAGQPFIGFIDRVFVPDGEVTIVDLKSGSRVPPTHLQHGLYAELMDQMYGVSATRGAFFKTMKGALTEPVDLDPYRPILPRLTDDLVKAKAANVFTPSPSALCGYCDVRTHCPIGTVLQPRTTPVKAKPSLRRITMNTKPEGATK